jgi:predicted CXXCH cytochrome family protein
MISEKKKLFAAVAVSLVFLATGTAEGRQIIFPPDGALVKEKSIEVLGFRPAKSGKGTLSVASAGPAQKKNVRPGQFTVAIALAPGVNTILFGGETVMVYFATGEVPSEVTAYQSPDRHAVDNGCDDCHSLGAEEAPLNDEVPALCYSCHDDFGEAEGVSLHPPVEDGECLECHAFHGKSVGSLMADLTALCYSCHDDFGEEEGVSLHPPVEDGECLECHDPHGTAQAALLTAAGSEICFNCHDNPTMDGSGEEWGVPHPALEEGCTSCHSPHASNHGSLLAGELPALCGECHDDKNADDEGKEWGTPHPPVEEGGCTDCHLPHGSAEDSLLSQAVPALCNDCHDDKNADDEGKEWEAPHSPVEEGGCTDCHLPHGSAEGSLLSQAVPALCYDCHDDKNQDEQGEEWLSPHPPVQEGRCLECHVPHGAATAALLPTRLNPLCLGCHGKVHPEHFLYEEPEDKGTAKVILPEDFPMTDAGFFLCTGCHVVHGSSIENLWKSDMSLLCTKCHLY